MEEIKFKKFKLALLIIVTSFDVIMLSFGLFLMIYNYDIYTFVLGAILVGLALIIGISDIILIKAWKYRDIKKIDEKNPEIKKLEEEIEEIKRKNNI